MDVTVDDDGEDIDGVHTGALKVDVDSCVEEVEAGWIECAGALNEQELDVDGCVEEVEAGWTDRT